MQFIFCSAHLLACNSNWKQNFESSPFCLPLFSYCPRGELSVNSTVWLSYMLVLCSTPYLVCAIGMWTYLEAQVFAGSAGCYATWRYHLLHLFLYLHAWPGPGTWLVLNPWLLKQRSYCFSPSPHEVSAKSITILPSLGTQNWCWLFLPWTSTPTPAIADWTGSNTWPEWGQNPILRFGIETLRDRGSVSAAQPRAGK